MAKESARKDRSGNANPLSSSVMTKEPLSGEAAKQALRPIAHDEADEETWRAIFFRSELSEYDSRPNASMRGMTLLPRGPSQAHRP